MVCRVLLVSNGKIRFCPEQVLLIGPGLKIKNFAEEARLTLLNRKRNVPNEVEFSVLYAVLVSILCY